MQNLQALQALTGYVFDQLTNAQKQAVFESIEAESLYYGDKLNYTYRIYFDAGIEWLECTIRDVTTFKFHY